MTHVTELHLRSGDRHALEDEADAIRQLLERKGVDCRGPHSDAPRTYRVPQHRRLEPGGGTHGDWEYTVYSRRLTVHGSDHVARDLGHRAFPSSVRVEIAVDRQRPAGSD